MNLTVKLKLIFTQALLTIVILSIGTFSFFMISKLSHQNDIFTDLFEAEKMLTEARLAQADYMLLEDTNFKDLALEHIDNAMSNLENVSNEMAVPESIETVANIQQSILDYQNAFLSFTKAKTSDIYGRFEFIVKGEAINDRIDQVLLSIETFFNDNQDDFSEFGRYLAAQDVKNQFKELQVAIWQFNTKATSERRDKIDEIINTMKSSIPELKSQMKSVETIDLLNLLEIELSIYITTKENVLAAADSLERSQSLMLSAANKASNLTINLLTVEEDIATQARQSSLTSIIIALVISTILSCVVAIWLIKGIITPLAKSVHFAQKVSEGDLTSVISVTGNDEFSKLNRALNESASALSKTITEIKTVFSTISDGNAYVESTVSEAGKSMQKQLNENESLAIAIDQSSKAIQDITLSANKASEESIKAKDATDVGSRITSKTSDAMGDLSNEVTTAGSYVDKLNTDVTSINDILSVITGIADQTNLLALNAAIEAARAGEQGRGFAVVADEVRTLAQKTQNSIEEITAIIDILKKGAANVVSVMESSTNKTQEVQELTEKATEAYAKIAEAITTITKVNMSVSSDSKQQSQVVSEINQNSGQIKNIAEQNGENLAKIQEQVTLQTAQIMEAQKLINFFKVA